MQQYNTGILVDAVCAAAAADVDDSSGGNNVKEALLAVGKANDDMSAVVKGMQVGCKFIPRLDVPCWCRWIDEFDSAMAAVDVGDCGNARFTASLQIIVIKKYI
jgi:hypothetical protein